MMIYNLTVQVNFLMLCVSVYIFATVCKKCIIVQEDVVVFRSLNMKMLQKTPRFTYSLNEVLRKSYLYEHDIPYSNDMLNYVR